MAQTSWGFDGSITEAQWAQMAGLLGNGYCVADAASLAPSAVAGARQVTIAGGTAYGDGVVTFLDAPETLTLSTPVSGQWFLIVLRRVWATNTTSLVAVAGSTTTTTVPSSPPSTFPSISTNVGVEADQPIAWAWANSANTTVIVSDLRQLPVRTVIQQPNYIQNGAFEINQRAFTSTTTNGAHGFDRWRIFAVTGTTTFSAQTLTPGSIPGAVSSQHARMVTSGQSGATAQAALLHRIEDVRTLAGKTVTVSFWAKAPSGTPSVAVEVSQFFGTGGSPSAGVTGSAALGNVKKFALSGGAVWTRYQTTLTVPSIEGQTLGTNDATSYLQLGLWTSAGTDSATRTDSLGIQNTTVDFWGVQLEEGTAATPFRRHAASIADELAACQRYYVRFAPATTSARFAPGFATGATAGAFDIPLRTRMRVDPVTISFSAASDFQMASSGSVTVTNITSSTLTSEDVLAINATASGAGFTTGGFLFLRAANTSAWIDASADL